MVQVNGTVATMERQIIRVVTQRVKTSDGLGTKAELVGYQRVTYQLSVDLMKLADHYFDQKFHRGQKYSELQEGAARAKRVAVGPVRPSKLDV